MLESIISNQVEGMREHVNRNGQELARIGNWRPGALERLVARIPTPGNTSLGADAGIFAALGLTPNEFVETIATLHAGVYTEELVNQIREERKQILDNPGVQNATLYWLLAGDKIGENEGGVTQERLVKQVADFTDDVGRYRSEDREAVRDVTRKALNEFDTITNSFTMFGNVPMSTNSGAIHGAYLSGLPFGTFMSMEYGLFFIGTYKDSMGLENFDWSNRTQNVGGKELPMSGPVVEGSYQFVKCSDVHEFSRAIDVVTKTLL